MAHVSEVLSLGQRIAYKFQHKPKVGDVMWWRGMRMGIVEVLPARLLFKYEGYGYKCTSCILEAVFNAEFGFWTMPGVEGELPKVVRGQLVDPDLKYCEQCEQRTHRDKSNGDGRLLCTGCREVSNG